MRYRAALGSAILLTVTFAGGQQAHAGFRVCNHADHRINAAIGYVDHVRGWVAEGWWGINVGQCQSVYDADLDNRYFYLYAKSVDGGTATWTGDVPFCIQDQKFTLLQAQYAKNTRDDCAAAGLASAQFLTVDVGQAKNHTHNLTLARKPEVPVAGGAAGPVAPQASAGGGNVLPRPYQPPVAPAAPTAPAAQPVPPAAPGGGGAGAACQRFPNLC